MEKKEEGAKDRTLRNPRGDRDFCRAITIQHHSLTSADKERASPVKNLRRHSVFLKLKEKLEMVNFIESLTEI